VLGHVSFAVSFESGSSAATAAGVPTPALPEPWEGSAPPGTGERGSGVRRGSVGRWEPPRRAGRGDGWEGAPKPGWCPPGKGRVEREVAGGEGPGVLKDEAGRGTKNHKLAGKAFRLGMERDVPASPRQHTELERLRQNHGQRR